MSYVQVDSEDEDGQEGGDDEGDVDSDDELLAGLDADPEVRFDPQEVVVSSCCCRSRLVAFAWCWCWCCFVLPLL